MKTFVDLFCGVGGFHIPLAERGLKCVFASEIDKHAAESYEANFGLKPHGDITTIDAATIPPHDVLCAGFPCQPFSNSGNGQGLADARGGLFHEIVRIATHCQPKVILLENVPAILTISKGQVLEVIRDSLDEAGYRVDWSVLNSGAYGVPQSRKRCYFVCIRKDLLLTFTPPKPLPPSAFKCVNDILLPDSETESLVLTRNDIVFDRHIGNDKIYTLRRIGYINSDGQGEKIYNINGQAPTQSVENGRPTALFLVPNEKPKSQGHSQGHRVYDPMGLGPTQMANGGGVGAKTGLIPVKSKISHGQEVWDANGLAATQTANSGGGGAKTGWYWDSGKVRTLHIDESKAVMGFPRSHIVSEGGQGFRQMGNAVIPAMVGFVYDGIK